MPVIIKKLKDITLKELQEYYDSTLVGKTFRYTLRPHKKTETKVIEVKFFTENLPHLLGIQKVVPKNIENTYKGEKGYQGILTGAINLDKLRGFDAQRKKGEKIIPLIETRLTHFCLMEELLLNCQVVKFLATGSTLNSDFILYHDELGVRLHLGVIQEQDGKNIYVPETFFVKKIRGKDIYTQTPPNVYMNVVKVEVI